MVVYYIILHLQGWVDKNTDYWKRLIIMHKINDVIDSLYKEIYDQSIPINPFNNRITPYMIKFKIDTKTVHMK